ncbi:hypothetical protein Scep_017918 [Stephania cephalantha]|uniref:Altered inheritance of mitochondria protein 32 n=1 Tax=Stephania cephalantha TaxID=152367 RepID=A0AAP0IQZ7_9MAGN
MPFLSSRILCRRSIFSNASLKTLISAMAGTAEDLSTTATADPITVDSSSLTSSQIEEGVVVVDPPPTNTDDVKYGFERPEMYSTSLAGTVDPYDRHVFLCFKSPESWPGRVEDPEYDPLPGRLAEFFKTHKDLMPLKTRLTICEGGEGTEFSDGDVLIFPDMVMYKGLTSDEVDEFGQNVLVKGEVWDAKSSEALIGSHVFVCAHGSRDRRCGVCGPALIEKFNGEIKSRGLGGQVFVRSCSHVGGHKYAGNVIIFSPDSEGKVNGHWFGYVSPDDVPGLLDEHIGKGVIFEKLWRGQMIASSNEINLPDDQKLQENSSGKNENDLSGTGKVDMQNAVTVSCCQGANGVSCCRDGNIESSTGSTEKKQTDHSGLCGSGLDRVSAWMGKLEQTDVLAVAAVIGAVASVAVAYSYYKRSH